MHAVPFTSHLSSSFTRHPLDFSSGSVTWKLKSPHHLNLKRPPSSVSAAAHPPCLRRQSSFLAIEVPNMSGQTNKRSSNETPPQLPIQSPRPTSTPTVSSIETTNPQAQHARGLDAPFFQQTTPQLFRVPQTPHSTTSEGHRTKNPKIAIPRLKKSADAVPSSARSSGRHRVNHACEPCRQRKTKCSGERPICKHCQDFKISCFYADGKRDRAKK